MTVCIYTIINKVSGKYYVGKSTNHLVRWEFHKSKLEKGIHENPHLQASFRKYGKSAFTFQIIEECGVEALDLAEHYWIRKLNATNRRYGYNVLD